MRVYLYFVSIVFTDGEAAFRRPQTGIWPLISRDRAAAKERTPVTIDRDLIARQRDQILAASLSALHLAGHRNYRTLGPNQRARLSWQI
jgi:hypothetical protein